MLAICQIPSPVGQLTLACENDALVGLWLAGQKYFAATLPPNLPECPDLPVFRQAKDWLTRYFAGERPAVDELQLRPAGSPFRQRVWQSLCRIPYGQVTTYGAIARELAAEQGKATLSAQAVGGAVGHNPISILIPCHRVVGANGSLTGYAGGLERKLALLRLEGTDLSGLFVPVNGTAL